MKIVIKVPSAGQRLVDSLSEKGIDSKVILGGVLITPYRDSSGYVVPEEVFSRKDFVTLIDCYEHGGATTNLGSATVVCSFRGKPLHPYYVCRRGHLCNGIHAYFSVPNVVVTVTAYHNDSNISIIMHRAIVNDNVVSIQDKELWQGEVDFLPKKHECYNTAIDAVVRKSNDYHCRSVYYVA
jgi:hypothetical protein